MAKMRHGQKCQKTVFTIFKVPYSDGNGYGYGTDSMREALDYLEAKARPSF